MKKSSDLTGEDISQALRQDYGQLAAWRTRSNRVAEPSRPPEPTRVERPPRVVERARNPGSGAEVLAQRPW